MSVGACLDQACEHCREPFVKHPVTRATEQIMGARA